MTFSEFFEKVQQIKANQANYQPVVICHLVNSINFRDTQESIAETLAIKNNLKKSDYKKFMGSCPVWKVLSDKGLIKKVDFAENVYALTVKLTSQQKMEISKVCMEMLRK